MQIKGVIKEIGEEVQITPTFKKRTFVLSYCENPAFGNEEEVEMELYQDKCDRIKDFKIGDEVLVSFAIRSKKWISPQDNSSRYFIHLAAWKIEKKNRNERSVVLNDDPTKAGPQTLEENSEEFPF